MKFLLSIAILLVICTCQHTEKEQVFTGKAIEDARAIADTFNLRSLGEETGLQKGILLDRINIPESKKHLGISMVYPKMSSREFPAVYKWIKKLVEEKQREFIEMTKDEEVLYDTSVSYPRGWSMWMKPMLLHQTEKELSFVIENGSGFTGMPSGFEYHVKNLDIEIKRNMLLELFYSQNACRYFFP